ncbi:MAG: hypothetical protein WCH59_01060 [Chitinophagia bacterium]|jgi:hypothetical protein
MKQTVTGILVLIFLIISHSQLVTAQVVWESPNKEIYSYLDRMAQKGLLQFNDLIKPLSRQYLGACLDSLSHQLNQLTTIEKKEWAFYMREYGLEVDTLKKTDAKEIIGYFQKDPYKRWRPFYANSKDAYIRAEPIFTATQYSGSNSNYLQSSSGVHVWAYGGKKWGFQFSYHDITEAGSGLDSTRLYSPETGFVLKQTGNRRSQNFTRFRGSVSYTFKNGSASIGIDQMTWGYGQAGKIVLSDKAPANPYLRLDYRPFSWLSFHYANCWLNSNLIDSLSTYGTGNTVYGGERIRYIPKFMATHSLSIQINRKLSFTAGESIVYSDQLDVGYLIPVNFFKVYDNIVNNGNILAGSNGQLFFQLSSRNQLPKTHLYTSLFIDEIRTSTMFDKSKSRNQLGYTLGASVTDLLLPYLTFSLEYTRVNPFVYKNLIAAQTYSSYGYGLGDWMGNNFDRVFASIRYTPMPRLKCLVSYQSIRKGGAGTVEQQYFQQPQPAFLFNPLFNRKELQIRCSYELINNLHVVGNYTQIRQQTLPSLAWTTSDMASVGFTFGL